MDMASWKPSICGKGLVTSLVVIILFNITAHGQTDIPPIKEGLWKTTVKIVSIYTNTVPVGPVMANLTGTGTGFLVSREVARNGRKSRVVYLATNKHIVGGWELAVGNFTNSCQSLAVHFYRTNLIPSVLQILNTNGSLFRPDLFLTHPNPSVDVALIPLVGPYRIGGELDNQMFDESYLARFSDTSFVNLGSHVFALGYPMGITSLKNNFPMAKSGYLASIPGEEFSIQINPNNRFTGKIYFVDGVIVPGNSGGPLLLPSVVKTMLRDDGQLAWLKNPTPNKVLGIVSQNTSAGFGIVYSSDYILELIDAFEKTIIDVAETGIVTRPN